MKPDYHAIAKRSLLLRSVPREVSVQLLHGAHTRSFARGATIFLQGERATAIYIVAEGWVKLYRIAPNGAEAVVSAFTQGASFGEAVAFRHDSYPVSAEAVTDCTLIRIEASAFLQMIQANPEIAISILSATFVHLQSLVAQIEQLKVNTAAQRVAGFLLGLADCTSGPCEVTLPYDKGLIAGRLGMKPESLSRAFVRLKKYGVRISHNRALIADIGKLSDYIGEDPALSWTR